MTTSGNTSDARQQALDLCREQTTESLVGSFKITDGALDLLIRAGVQPERIAAMYESRGFIIDVLAERDALHLVGLDLEVLSS